MAAARRGRTGEGLTTISVIEDEQFFARVTELSPPARSWMDRDHEQVLFTSHGQRYLAKRLRWPAPPARIGRAGDRRTVDGVSTLDDASDKLAGDLLGAHPRYGGPASFLVDMQGIEAFLFGRAKLFRDETARQAARAVGLVSDPTTYLRIGAAGAPPTAHHPGGEVLECSLLRGPLLSGDSRTVSGYLPPGDAFSRAAPLVLNGGMDLLDRRSVYSHTAFLAAGDAARTMNRVLRITGQPDGLDVLTVLQRYARVNGIRCYAIRILVDVTDRHDPPTVVGRVLRRLPQRRLRDVQEATDLASEQRFQLRPGQRLECFGTYYPRRAVDWEALRGGRPYEPRGHIHMAIRGRAAGLDQHAISHLRELFVTPGTRCFAILTPASDVVRVDPVVLRHNRLVSRCSGRALMEEFRPSAWRRVP